MLQQVLSMVYYEGTKTLGRTCRKISLLVNIKSEACIYMCDHLKPNVELNTFYKGNSVLLLNSFTKYFSSL